MNAKIWMFEMLTLTILFIYGAEVFAHLIFLLDLFEAGHRNSHGSQEMFLATESIRYHIFLARFMADGKVKLLKRSIWHNK